VLTTKALVVPSLIAVAAAVTIPLTDVASNTALGEHGRPVVEGLAELGWRSLGAGIYWVPTGLIALAVTAGCGAEPDGRGHRGRRRSRRGYWPYC
jgi:hypothetical protein